MLLGRWSVRVVLVRLEREVAVTGDSWNEDVVQRARGDSEVPGHVSFFFPGDTLFFVKETGSSEDADVGVFGY